jgi:hypothetical protein
MILNFKFARAIGLYYSMASALGIFGIRIKVLALKLGIKQLVVKNSVSVIKEIPEPIRS